MEGKEMLVMEAMERYGGSFVKSLATCLRLADHVNFKKLKETFPEFWNQYSHMAKYNNNKGK